MMALRGFDRARVVTGGGNRGWSAGGRAGCSGFALVVALVAAGTGAQAREVADCADDKGGDRLCRLEARLDQQERRIDELEAVVAWQAEEIAARDRTLAAERAEVQSLQLTLAERDGLPDAPRLAYRPMLATGAAAWQDAPQGQGQAQGQGPQPGEAAQPAAGQVAAGPQEPDEGRPQSEQAVDQLLLDQGGVLLSPGRLQIEPSFEYTSISSDRVNISGFSIFNAIVIGSIRVDDVNRDILTGSITARYGTGSRSQVDLRVPFVYRNDTETTGIGTGDATERAITGHGLGDIGLTLSWQALAARKARPATILRVAAEYPTGRSAFEIPRVPVSEDSPEEILTEAPTGSGFFTVSPGVTFVWPIDPVVLFAGGAYNLPFGKRFDDFGFVDPGHGFEFFAGMNMSINERVSMNFSFLDAQRFATRSNGTRIPGSGTHDARLSLGAAIGLSDRTSLVISTATGLTDESPDFTFGIRLPTTF
ncbi:hypothetical protein [Erythrobacter sp. HL-111]|uniref:hypothetical protein n=1 Tax=Erythrobacter sp. HL-111 TaxID=1798193 RepID=UPI0006DAB0B0|nr:hypothetical protein [Erythrobacter sp. HL-111]KPP92919.1 MAG: SlyX [Erythrobacteraceae bacterium HL-111]SDT01790.1 hypothetical protein SAMN04515621_2726 [Erythrobacter sp. HL-111]